MAILKRINKYQGLKDIDILVEETGLTSQYFQVYDFPDQVPQGKSSFLVAGSPFLADNVELKVEILDSGGNTIYTEAITDYLEGGARRVSIEVYDDVVPGDGFMYIVGELKSNYKTISALNNNNDDITGPPFTAADIAQMGGNDVPEEFQGVYNVRYVRPVFINAALPNSQPIFFYQQPRVNVTEVVKPFIEQLAPSGSIVLSGSVEANPAPDLAPLPAPIDPPAGFPKNPTAEGLGKIGQINEIFKSSKKSKSNPFRNSGFRSRGRLVRRSSPEQDRFSMRIHALEESNETTKDKASSALVGATLKIKSPKIDLVKYPADKFEVPTEFETSIKKVLNEETIVPVDDFFITRKDTLEKIPVPIIADEVSGGGQSEVTMSYTPFPQQSLSATHNRSFADITVANLRTFSGDVYKTKIYGKSQGSLGDFELLHEGTIESPQTLIDPFSTDGFLNIGYFHTQSIVDSYWLLDGGTAVRDDSKIIDGIQISGSNYSFKDSVEFSTSGSFSLEKGVPYSITFNAHYFKEDKVNSDGSVGKDFELDVLVDEAALIGGSLQGKYQSIGKIDLDGLTELEGSIPGVYTTFLTPSDVGPTLKLKFKLNSGRAIINDVVVRPHSETNFNPDFFRVVLPMPYPLPKQPDLYDFLVEFYDVNNNIAETFTIGQNIEFVGAPLNIDGEDNLLSGSLFIGSAQGSGFEMAGVSSAFLRSIGYNGFDKTIAENKGGFLIFSGSIGDRLTASEAYEGVGIEIVDAHTSQDRYLKFRTNPSTFEVVTDQFFFGQAGNSFVSGSNGNIEIFSSGTTTLSGSNVDILTPNFFLGGSSAFVSGSGGNIEISSSNFHLTAGGDVTMSGDITANAGFIGDWAIVDGQISGSNITLNADNSTIFKTDQGPGSDTGQSFAQLKDEYYIDFTPEEESPDNFYVKFGPNFMVNKDGILIASGATFEGSITASQGLIGGFTTDSSSFHSNNIFISGSPAIGGVDHPRYMFISSSNFNVKENGDITGSSALFDGNTSISGTTTIGGNLTVNGTGTIASFGLTETAISSSNDKLILKSSGEITSSAARIVGSDVDIDVEKFELDANNLEISSTHSSMSLGEGKIDLVGGSTSFIQVGSANAITLKDDGTDRFLVIGSKTSFSHFNQSTAGVILGTDGGTTKFEVVGDASNYISFNGAAFDIKSEVFGLKTSTQHISSSNGGVIAMGSTIPQKVEQAGIFLSGSGQFSFYSSSRGHIVFDGTDFKIASKNLTIDTSTLDINTAGGGNIALGSGTPSLSAAGIFLSGSGDFNFQKDSNNFIRQSGGAFQIKSSTFDLDATTLIMDSAGDSGTGIIRLGASGGPSSPTNGTAGIYMDGGGALNVVGNATNFFRVDGGSFTIKSDTFDLQTTTISMSSADTGKIALGQTPPTRYDSGNGIFFDGDANFLIGSASGDKIQFTDGDFIVQVGSLELDASNIEISSTNASMSLGEGNIILDGANNKINVGKTSNKKIEIVGSSTQGYIATGKDSATSTTAGFWLANNNTDPEFAVGDSTDFIRFNGGNLDINSQKLEIAASTLQLSTTEASMSLGHNAQSGSYGRVILEGAGVPTLRIGKQAHTITLTSGSGIYMDGDGNFRMGDSDGGIKFNNGSFSITGSDVDIDVTDVNITSTGFRLSSTNASMSLGTNDQLFMHANSTSPFLSIGQSTKGFEQTGTFLGFVNSVSRPRVSFVGTAGHFKFDTGVDIQTNTFEMDANTGDLQISSAHKSMSLGDQSIVLNGAEKKITIGTGNKISIVGGATDNFITMGSKTGMDGTQGSGTAGIIIGMDGSNPQAEFVKSATEYFIYDNGIDMKTLNFELSANSGNLQISSADKAIRLSSGSSGQVTIQGDGTDGFISMGSKGSFANEGSGTAGIIIGMDGTNPQAEFVKNSTNYFIFDDGIDIKTDTFKLDTTRLDIDSSTSRVQVFDSEGDEVLRLGEISDSASDLYGLKVYDGAGTGSTDTLVKLGGEGNEIAGWTITNDRLSGGNMIIRQDGTIESAGFASDVAGSGFRLTAAQGGFLEVENAKIRGTLATAVFEKESVNAVGGQLYVANSTVLTSSAFAVNAIHTAAQETMSVANVTGFSSGEILSLKKVSSTGFATEYVKVYSASRNDSTSDVNFAGNLFVTRSFGQGLAGDSGSLGESPAVSQSYSGSQVIVSTGKLNTGYIRLNANPNDETTPYMDIVERTGSGIYDVELKARLGDLSGLSSGLLFGETSPGFGLFTENVFLKGAITATTGSITGQLFVNTSDSERLILGVDISGTNDGLHINDNNYWYTTGAWKVGGSTYNISNDSSGNLSLNPKSLDINVGTDFELSSTHKSMSFADGDLLLKKDGSDAVIQVGGTTSKQITIKGSNTQGYIASGKTSAASLTEGFWIANNNTDAEFHIGDGTSAIKFDDNQLHITSSKFELDAGEGDLQISSLHKSMSLGDGSFEVIGDQSNNLTKLKVGQHTIQNIQMTGSSNAGIMKSGKKGINDLNAGFYMSNEAGTAKFHVGDGTSALKFDGSNLHITASQANLSGDGVTIDVNTFELEAANVEISSGEASMSVGYDDSLAGGINIVGGATSTIGFGTKASPRMKLSSTATDSFLQIGSPTIANPAQEGILIANDGGNAELHLYKDGSNYFKYDAGATPAFDLKTTSLEIATAGLSISGRSSTAASNKISLGTITSDSDTSGAGVFMDGGGHFRVFGDANNFMIVDGGSLQIKSDNIDMKSTVFSLDANSGDLQLSSTQKSASFANGKIVIEGSSTNGSLKIGGVGSTTDTGGSNKGFYAEGDGDFIAKAGANEYIKFDNGKLGLKASDVSIVTTGTNKIKLESSASTPQIALGTTLPTAYNSGVGFYADGTGKLLVGNAAGNKLQFDGSTLTVAGTINILGGDLAGIDGDTISGSYPPASASQDLGFATQVVLDSAGMSLKNGDASKTLAIYGATAKIFDGLNSNTYVEVGGKGITQVSGSVTGSLLTNGVMSLFGAGAEKAVFSSTGSLFRGDAQNTFTRVDSNGLTIVDNGVTQGTFTNGTINLYGNNGTDRKVTIDSDGFKAYYDSNNYINVNSSTMDIYAGSATAAASFGTTITLRGNNSNDDKITINSDGIVITEGGNEKVNISGTGTKLIGDGSTTYGLFNSGGVTLVDNNVTGSVFNSTNAIIYGASTNDRVVVNADGLEIYTANVKKAEAKDTGFIAYGDDVNTYAQVNSSGLTIVEDSVDMANFGSDVRVGADVNNSSFVTITSTAINFITDVSGTNTTRATFDTTGAKLFGDGSTTYALLNSGGLTLVDNDVTGSTFTSAKSTIFGASANDRVEVTADGLEIYTANVKKAEAKDTGFIAYGDDVNTYAQVNSSGLTIVEDSVDMANFGSDVRIGADVNDSSFATFTSTAVNFITDVGGTNTTRATYDTNGAKIFGDGSTTYMLANSAGLTLVDNDVTGSTIKSTGTTIFGDDANTKAVMSSAGMTIFNDGTVVDPATGVSHFGTTLRIGAVADDTSRLEVDSDGNLTIKNRQGTTDTTVVSLTDAGALSLTGAVTATSGFIGNGASGFTIGNTAITNGKTSLTSVSTGVYLGTDGIGVGTNGTGHIQIAADGDYKAFGTNASFNVQMLTNFQENNPGIIMQRPALGITSGVPYTLRISSTGSYYDSGGDYSTNVDSKTLFSLTSQAAEGQQHPDVGDVAFLDTTGYVTTASTKLFNINNTNVGSTLLSFNNQNIKFSKLSGGGSTVRISLKFEVYENNIASMTIGDDDDEAKLVETILFNNVTYSWDTQYTLTAMRALITKQYFFAKVTLTSIEQIGGAVTDPLWEMGGNTGTSGTATNTVIAFGYITKSMIMNKGFQTYAGPYSEARFGSQNKIIGNMQILTPPNFTTGGKLAIEGGLVVGDNNLNVNNNYTAYIDGDMGATGNVVAYVTSDERLKEEIVPIGNGLELVQKMNPVNFRWNDDGIMFGWGLQNYKDNLGYDLGFIAQELQTILPEVIGKVKSSDNGEEYLGVHYEKIVPVLVSAIKEQQKQIDELKELVKKLTEDK